MELDELILYIKNQMEKVRDVITNSTKTVDEFEEKKHSILSNNNDQEDAIIYFDKSDLFAGFNNLIMTELNDINILNDLANQIETNLENIDIESFQWKLPKKVELFDNLSELKNLYSFAINPNFQDEELKKSVFILKVTILDKINLELQKSKSSLTRVIETIEMKVIRKYRLSIEDNKKYYENLELYLDICNKSKKLLTDEEINLFFEFIKSSPLSKDAIYKLIIDFSKEIVSTYNQLIRKKQLRDKLIVNKNKADVHEKLRQMVIEEIPKVENINDKNLEALTPSEKLIYDKVEKLLENYTHDEMFLEIFEGNFSLEDRISYYGAPESIDWRAIKSDFIDILVPNLLGEHKEEILNIFNYILQLNDKNLEYQETVRRDEQKLQENMKIITERSNSIIKQIEQILRKHRYELEYLNQSENHKNLCEGVYKLLIKQENETADLMVQGSNYSKEYYALCYVINEINDVYECIKASDLKLEELEYMCESIEKWIKEYEVIINELPKEAVIGQINSYDGKNFVCFMNEEIDYSDFGKKEEILKSIKFLKNYEWHDIVSNRAKNHLWNDLTHKNASGRDVKYTNDLFSVGRIWATNSYRTGIVVIRKIHPENKEKIMRRYNLEKVGVIAFIIGAIYVEADHKEYLDLTDFVSDEKNMATINYYVSLFGDPNTPEENLFEILDKGIKDCEKINLDQVDIGGPAYE